MAVLVDPDPPASFEPPLSPLEPAGLVDGGAARVARLAASALRGVAAVVVRETEVVTWVRRPGTEDRALVAAALVRAGVHGLAGVTVLADAGAPALPDWAAGVQALAGWRAVAAAPIGWADGPAGGLLVVADAQPRPWSDDELVMLRDLALLAASQ